ncbi:copper resistance protein CopC [Amycolatopsis mongoliensis]|uniref:Copper resistance protein CopC n=1 Tax=Amycolatopsis mongoliensis TaxID=715475 RepID=A0A9Y2JKB8_9PSEU|nr:copper resistance CopC family protein [Amycolatopsis sp. 4-36]WIX98856.1 copper resistance protein CopC [Amycolatopsis sp. 4-36]
MTAVRERPRGTVARRRGVAGRLVALVVLVAACWGVLLATTPAATGDPVLVTTSPGSTEVVKSPDTVALTFDRPVPAALATVRILDPDGSQVVFERPVHPDGREDTISVRMPAERHEGTYAVAWTLPSSRLEPISGSFTFDVSYPIKPDGVPEIETTRDPVLVVVHLAARTVAIVAMVVLAGVAFFVAAIGPAAARTRSARRLVKTAWWLVTGGTLVALVSFGPYAAWVPVRDAFDPRLLSDAVGSVVGGALLARLFVLVPVTLGLAWLMTSPPAATAGERRLRGAGVLGCATAVLATWTLADPRAPGAPTPLALCVDVVLLVALALPVAGLLVFRLPVARDRDTVSRFVRPLLACAGLLVVAGAVQAWGAHRFGWYPAGALVLASVLAAFAWLSAHRVAGPVARQRRFNRRVAGVAGLVSVIVVATAALLALDPAGNAHAQGAAGQAPAAIRQQVAPTRLAYDTGKPAGQGSVDLVLIPVADRLDARVSLLGPHRVDTTVTAALVRGDRTTPVPVDRAGPGYWTGQATVPEPGRWDLALTLRAADGSTQTVKQPIDVR